MDNEIKILVFKTNLETHEGVQAVRPVLDEHPEILKWNIDQWDIDNVLRIETYEPSSAKDIISMIMKAPPMISRKRSVWGQAHLRHM